MEDLTLLLLKSSLAEAEVSPTKVTRRYSSLAAILTRHQSLVSLNYNVF